MTGDKTVWSKAYDSKEHIACWNCGYVDDINAGGTCESCFEYIMSLDPEEEIDYKAGWGTIQIRVKDSPLFRELDKEQMASYTEKIHPSNYQYKRT